MFDYARKMQLAVSDAGRRVALKAAAGVVALIGAGFLLAALWTFLADNLDWGPLGASLAIGLVFVIIGVALIAMSKSVKHPVPTTDELRAEVETRVSLAADAALDRAKGKAAEVVDTVEQKVMSVVGDVTRRAEKFAHDAEDKVHGFARNVTGGAADKFGLTSEVISDAKETFDRVKESNAATIPPLIGAFAIGIALANKFQSWRHERDVYDDYYDDVYYDDEI